MSATYTYVHLTSTALAVVDHHQRTAQRHKEATEMAINACPVTTQPDQPALRHRPRQDAASTHAASVSAPAAIPAANTSITCSPPGIVEDFTPAVAAPTSIGFSQPRPRPGLCGQHADADWRRARTGRSG